MLNFSDVYYKSVLLVLLKIKQGNLQAQQISTYLL